jgi:hypothetical protein
MLGYNRTQSEVQLLYTSMLGYNKTQSQVQLLKGNSTSHRRISQHGVSFIAHCEGMCDSAFHPTGK